MFDRNCRFEPPGDELRDEDYPDEYVDDDETKTFPCPECGADVYEDAVRCPVCGTYVAHSIHVFAGRPLWWIALGLLGILAVIMVLAGWAGP